MPQRSIELILMRQLASYLGLPIFLVDPAGNLVFYNEPAERILGRRFEETGEMTAAEWSTVFQPTDDAGHPVAPESVPLMIAWAERRPVHESVWIRALDGVPRRIAATAFPLIGQAGRYLGAVAIFWESGEP